MKGQVYSRAWARVPLAKVKVIAALSLSIYLLPVPYMLCGWEKSLETAYTSEDALIVGAATLVPPGGFWVTPAMTLGLSEANWGSHLWNQLLKAACYSRFPVQFELRKALLLLRQREKWGWQVPGVGPPETQEFQVFIGHAQDEEDTI